MKPNVKDLISELVDEQEARGLADLDYEEPVIKPVTVRLDQSDLVLAESLAVAFGKSRHEMLQSLLKTAIFEAAEAYNNRTGKALEVPNEEQRRITLSSQEEREEYPA